MALQANIFARLGIEKRAAGNMKVMKHDRV